MIVSTVKTARIKPGENIFAILDSYLPRLEERSVVVITSKIISLCENRVIPFGQVDLNELIKSESDYYLQATGKYGQHFTITKNVLIARAGIDTSQKNGYYILWPKDAQKTANDIRKYLSRKHHIKELGIIVSDSTSMPLHLGVTGIALGFSGIHPLNEYVYSQANIVSGLAAAAVVTMGEGTEQTPIALISNVDFVKFNQNDPSQDDIAAMNVSLEDDFFEPILKSLPWQAGTRQKL